MTLKAAFWIISAVYWLLGMHFFMHNEGGAGLYLPFNVWGWIFGSLIIGLGLWKVAQRQRLAFSSMQKWLWLGALLMFLPMAYPGFELKAHALPRLLGLFAGLLFLFSLYQWQFSRQDRDRLLHLLLGAVALEAAFGLVQFYLLSPGNWIGYRTEVNRPHGIFQQPNVMASFLATGIALAIWLELRSTANAWLRVLRCGVIVAASLLLIVLQSRVGQLGAVLVLLLLAPQLYRNRRLLPVLVLVGLGVGAGLLSLKIEGQQVAQRGLEIYQSAGVRTLYWAHAAELIAQSPWSGWGYGGFEATFLHQYADKLALNPGLPSIGENIDHPHNEFLYWAIEGGLAPMLGLVLMAGAMVWRVSRAGWSQGMALLALVTPILLHTQTEYPLYHAVALWWALLLLLHVMDAEVEEDLHHEGKRNWTESIHRPRLLMQVAAILIPMVVVPFMLTGLHTAWLMTQFEREGRKNMHWLESIVNPLPWLGRIENTVQTMRMQDGIFGGDTSQLEAYMAWAKVYVQHTPRARTYSNMTLALQVMGRTEEAKEMQAQGLRLYPGHPGISKALSAGALLGK